jgi:hypothetical protein
VAEARAVHQAQAEARAAARPAAPAKAKALAAWLDHLHVELESIPGWIRRLGPDHPEGASVASVLQEWPEAAQAWVGKVRGPPLVARNALVLSPLAPEPVGTTTAQDLAATGALALEGLRQALRKLDSYASYRSSFPPALRAGYDQRLQEVQDAADAVAATLDAVWAMGS